MRVKNALVVVACACMVTVTGAVHAEEPDEATKTAARALGGAGVAAYQASDFNSASDRLEKAYALLRVPSLALWSARALVKRGLLVEAAERYLEATNLQAPSGDAAVQKRAQTDARAELAVLRPKIPNIIVKLTDAGPTQATVRLDNEELASASLGRARLVNPGAHRAIAQRGSDQADGSVTVAEGETKTIELSFSSVAADTTAASSAEDDAPSAALQTPPNTDASARPGAATRTAAWVALGAGGAGLAVGAITGILAAGKKSTLKESGACIDDRCATSQTDTVNSLNSMRSISGVAFIAGGVLAGTGIVLLLSSGSSGSSPTQAVLTPTTFSLRRSFW